MSMPPLPSSLTQMLWFVRIVEAGSFSEAARRANTSTSAMSKAVSRLEQSHGVRLLNRSTHSLSLTPEGDRLLAVGKKLLDDLEDAESGLVGLGNQGSAGRVRLSAPRSFAIRCILPHFPDFLRDHPDIAIDIEFKNDFLNMAVRGVDIAVGSGDITGLPGHFVRQLCTFPWIACASPAYFAANGAPKLPSDLSKHRLVGFRDAVTGQFDSWRFRHPKTGGIVRHLPLPYHSFDDPEAAWSAIRGGFGIGFGPAWLGREDWERGSVVETLRDWRNEEAKLYAVRLDKKLTPKRVHAVQEFVVDVARRWADEFARSDLAAKTC